MTNPAGRLVFLTEESVNALIDGKISARSLVWQAWLAAPADPAEAVRQAIGEFDGWVITGPDEYADIARAVLAALGVPSEASS